MLMARTSVMNEQSHSRVFVRSERRGSQVLHFPTVRRRRTRKGAIVELSSIHNSHHVRCERLQVFRVDCRVSLDLKAFKISFG